MPYNIAKITRELQQEFKLFTPRGTTPTPVEDLAEDDKNRATPENLKVLLDALTDLTKELRAKRGEMSDWLPDIGILQWDLGMVGWSNRLEKYHHEVDKAPKGDRQDVLWSVTAPLLLGFFGGENSDKPQQPIDAVTPFMLANQLEVDDAWRDERWDLLKGDLEDGVKSAATAIAGGLGIAALFAGGLALAWWMRR